jgi:NTE family protein
MIGLALSGGGSRAIAFHLGCLRALDDLAILEKIEVLSTISGGSVIGAYFAYTPNKSFYNFEADIRGFLKAGFHRKILIELFRPKNLLPSLWNALAVHRSRNKRLAAPKCLSRTDMFRNVLQKELFPGLTMGSPRRDKMDVVIGACELRTGSAFRFGTQKSGSWRLGEMVMGNANLAFAVAASAAYPILLPAFDRTWKFLDRGVEVEHQVFLTDGGIYDNLGVQVLEPRRDAGISLHTFPCDYIIACNADQGQEIGKRLPTRFVPRVERSFQIIHRRVQEATMHRLHHLKEAGLIKGFALPYLGQHDDRLHCKPVQFVSRAEVVNYPTDFAPMCDTWIDKLSSRGEQLTRELVSQYLPDIL